MKIALHQMTSTINWKTNIAHMKEAIKEAASEQAKIYFAPEMSILLDKNRKRSKGNIMPANANYGLEELQKCAHENNIWLHLGSLPILLDEDEPRLANRSYVIDNEGNIRASYDKIHLFDVQLSNGEHWKESSAYRAGEAAVTVKTPIGTLGLSICYDLRFAELYLSLIHI